MPHSVHASSSPASSNHELSNVSSSSASEPEDSQNAASNPTEDGAATGGSGKQNLLEMFDDEEEQDEYTSSAATTVEPSLPQGHGSNYTDPGIMRAFYQRLFPYRYLFQWLNHSPQPTNDFAHREFAFTLPGDIYARYQSFQTADLFRKALVTSLPTRFEIGPIYSTNPRDRKSLRPGAVFKPLQKEIVLDIDMTDYDSIRTCCAGAAVCSKCWAWMRAAIKTLDVALKEDFGWRHILWVYSGRRGVHAWICDKDARTLDDRTRTAVANYLEVLKGGDSKAKKVALRRPLHPHLERSLKILRETFQRDILKGQDPWRDAQRSDHLLSLLPDSTLNAALKAKWEADPSLSSQRKWADIDELAADSTNHGREFDSKKLLEGKQDVVFEYTYPRLDAAVSKHLNHLLKSPFCVHPKSGRVCVPISPDDVDTFDPDRVPTVTELLEEVDQWQGKDGDGDTAMDEGRKVQDWEKTRLKPYVEYFRTFVAELVKEELKASAKRKVEEPAPMEF